MTNAMYPPSAEHRLCARGDMIRRAWWIYPSTLATDTYDLAMRAFAATIMAHIANLRATAEMAEEVICRSRAFLAAQCPGDPGEPAVSAAPQPSYDEKLHVAHRLIKALREQGHRCELRHAVTLH